MPSGNTGSTVILEGAAFGDVQGTSQVLFSNGTGGTVAATIASAADWTDGFIITTVPSGAATGELKVVSATGSSNVLTFALTSNAAFSPSTISWSSTTALPVGLSGHDAAFAIVQGSATNNNIYVTGGADTTRHPRTSVYFSPIQSNGQLGAWTATAVLPAARAFHASVIATPANSRVKGTGYIYLLGGTSDSIGTVSSTIYRATLSADGSVSSWAVAGQLPAPLHSMGAVIFRGDVYIAGGSSTGNVPVATVYRARLDSLGVLGSWQQQPALPSARSHHGFAQFGGHLYSFGGETGSAWPHDASTTDGTRLNEVVYAKIDLRTGNLAGTSWTVNPAALQKAVSKHTAVVAGGTVLVSAGLYNGASTGASEQTYASFNSDGTVGSFQGATGARTIASAGGKNLFNHVGLSYVDGSGVAHVLIIGGDDVNAPGKVRPEVWFY